MKTLNERINAYAELTGTKATTPKGKLRAIRLFAGYSTCSMFGDANRGLSGNQLHGRESLRRRAARLLGDTAIGGVACTQRHGYSSRHAMRFVAIDDIERDCRRARDDVRFRRVLARRIAEPLASPYPSQSELSARIARDARYEAALIAASYGGRIRRPYGLAPVSTELAKRLGYNLQYANPTWEAAFVHSVTAASPTVKWTARGPRTIERAARHTRIRAVAVEVAGGCHVSYEGTRRTIQAFIPNATLETLTADGLLASDVVGVRRSDGIVTRYESWGRDVYVESGFTVPVPGRPGEFEHGATIEECEAELARKAAIRNREVVNRSESARDARAVRLLARISAYSVDFAAARESGACRAGIESWARARGVDLVASVTLAKLARDVDEHARRIASFYARRLWTERKTQQKAA